MFNSLHFQRIHARVWRRVWLDLPLHTREVIANDTLHETTAFKSFENKVMNDARLLYEDPNYYDNLPNTFKYSRVEPIAYRA